MQFAMAPDGVYDMDVLVSPNLNDRDYGLLALRDVIRHFDVTTRGEAQFDEDGEPLQTPEWVLIPRNGSPGE